MAVLIILFITIVLLCGRYSVICGSLGREELEKIRRYSAYLIIMVITSARYNVGWDYTTYYKMLKNPGGASYFEPIVRCFYYISQYFEAPWLLFTLFFVSSMIFIILGIEGRSCDKYESLIIFMSLFYFESLNIMRQFLAIAILFYAFKYIQRKKLLRYLIWILIASLVHTSAWFALPIYFIYNYIELDKTIIITFIGILFVDKIIYSVLHLNIFYKYYRYYMNLLNDGGRIIKYFYLLIFIICIIAYYQKRRAFDDDISKTLSVLAIGVVFPFIIGSHMGLRITYYYASELIIIIPKMIAQFRLRVDRRVFMLPFYAYYVMFLAVDYMNNKGFSPFIFYWNRR